MKLQQIGHLKNLKLQKLHWLLMYFLSRFNLINRIILRLYPLVKPKIKIHSMAEKSSDSLFRDLEPAAISRTLRQEGFYAGLTLPPDIVQEIHQFIEGVKCFPDHDGSRLRNTGISCDADQQRYRSNCSRSRYQNEFQACPAIERLIRDPILLEIAANYLNGAPIYMGARLWWSHADAPPYDFKRAGQVFHYDIDDYHALRFFFYLTDVDIHGGPHVVIRGSHTHKKFRDQFSRTRFRSDEELINFYGREALVQLCGSAGYGFAEDPKIYHKGIAPRHRSRLILLLRYGIHDFGNRN